ncbi:3'-5' exoribonuclease [Pseudomonas serbica]|uniref:3'-5' exoribonuclease n=1 Tax=Pseudomonas serbica TaxID=2965074 RepID=UPI00237AE08D|nr:3'-5' exoribonuclease [Pseudomonas serbica]
MKVFLDCEFTQINAQAKLISLALVAEDGRELYVELSDSYGFDDCSGFVKEYVLRQLDQARYGCTLEEAQAKLAGFVSELHSNIQILSDAPEFDWEFFCELMYVDSHWPVNVSNRPLNLRDWYNELESNEIVIYIPEVPHHALFDARILASLYRSISAQTKTR